MNRSEKVRLLTSSTALTLWIGGLAVSIALGVAALAKRPKQLPRVAVVGNPAKVAQAYAAWKDGFERSGRENKLELPLGWSKGRSSSFTTAHGAAELDLERRTIAIEATGLARDVAYRAWLLAYVPDDRTAKIDSPAGTRVDLGVLAASNDGLQLERSLPAAAAFELDLIVIAPDGADPRRDGLLYGSPSLFDRLYSMEHRDERQPSRRFPGGLLLAIATPTPLLQAGVPPVQSNCLDQMVVAGEALFFSETFDGNGRTCGTCHPAENNLTIDPAFIATLPPTDPLFVAEFTPALDASQNGGLVFEQPVLMRQFGLIVENLDGFGDLTNRFVMRGVPHVFAQALSIVSPQPGVYPVERTGWSGDGAPNSGSLRDFTDGAIRQHFTKTMSRMPGADFRFATADELNNLEAFMLSLGRQTELNIFQMNFTDPDVTEGRERFVQPNGLPSAVTCHACHDNAGANEGAQANNKNFDTGTEDFLQNHGDVSARPLDGGFGTNPQGGFDTVVLGPEGFGNGRFNTPSIVEFADTLPAFHNNITNSTGGSLVDTVEDAVRFYTTDEFINSPAGVDMFAPLTAAEIDAAVVNIAKFLRVINALENERQARERADLARCMLVEPLPTDYTVVNRALTIAVADVEDAVQVLASGGLHARARAAFQLALGLLAAAKTGSDTDRVQRIDGALIYLTFARADMVN